MSDSDDGGSETEALAESNAEKQDCIFVSTSVSDGVEGDTTRVAVLCCDGWLSDSAAPRTGGQTRQHARHLIEAKQWNA